MDIWKELADEGVDKGLLEEMQAFRAAHPAPEEARGRVPGPRFLYYGKEIWEGAAAALLCGQHLLYLFLTHAAFRHRLGPVALQQYLLHDHGELIVHSHCPGDAGVL